VLRPLNHADIVSTAKTPRPPRQGKFNRESPKPRKKMTDSHDRHCRTFGLSRFIRVCILGVVAVIQKSLF